MCSSGVGFNPVVDGVRYTFDVAGLYNGLFAMADRQSGSVWSHFEGAALFGALAGARLEIVPLVQMRWADWLMAHPDTLVLDPATGFEARYRERSSIGGAGLGPAFERTLLHRDDRLAENELVLGVSHGGEARAYPLGALPSGPAATGDVIGLEPIVVLSDVASGQAMAFSRRVGGEVVEFAGSSAEPVDVRGGVWSLDGRCRQGWCDGLALEFVTSFVTEWYGWVAYHPQTSIFGR